MAKSQQEILDEIVIGVSPLTKRIYIGIPEKNKPNCFKAKSDFTDRMKNFAPQLFPNEDEQP